VPYAQLFVKVAMVLQRTAQSAMKTIIVYFRDRLAYVLVDTFPVVVVFHVTHAVS
jgi:hypothetical protein